MAKRKSEKLLQLGDVLKTHPYDEYWGCAVVLAAKDATSNRDPMCLIGITDFVSQTDYLFDEIDWTALSILEFDREIRVGPNDYQHLRTEVCIRQYSRKYNSFVDVIGSVGVSDFSEYPLTFDVGDGSGNGYPLCGAVTRSLGSEAVISWRKIHDLQQWLSEVAAAREETERVLEATKGT